MLLILSPRITKTNDLFIMFTCSKTPRTGLFILQSLWIFYKCSVHLDPTDFPHPFFSYQSMWELSGYPYQGIFQTYSGGGYVAELGATFSEAQMVLKFLRDNSWVDKRTRAVFIEANIFNPNMNLWGISLYLCEFLQTGGKQEI